MKITSSSTPAQVATIVRYMFGVFGTSADHLRHVLLWVLKLPGSDGSLVPAVSNAVVEDFLRDNHVSLDRQSFFSAAGAGGGDCFGSGSEAEVRRRAFAALLRSLAPSPGGKSNPWRNIDQEMLVAFRQCLDPSLRLSDDVLALPSFAALLAQVLHFLDHGPASILASAVESMFGYQPYPTHAPATQILRCFRADLLNRIAADERLREVPLLAPTLFAASVVPIGPGAGGANVQRIIGELRDLAADSQTTQADLIQHLDTAVGGVGSVGACMLDWSAPPPDPFNKLLTPRGGALAAASPAAAAVPTPPASPAKASAKQPRPAQPAAASSKSQRAGESVRLRCPHGAGCLDHGSVAKGCPHDHDKADHDAIVERLRQRGLPFVTTAMRKAIRSAYGGGAGAREPAMSVLAPPAPAAAAVAPASAASPPPHPPAAVPPAVHGGAPAGSASAMLAALDRFLASSASPSQAALPLASAAIPAPLPSFPRLSAASAPAAVPSPASEWAAGRPRMACIDSGTYMTQSSNPDGTPTHSTAPCRAVTSDGSMSVSSEAFHTFLYVPEPGSERVFKLDLAPQVQPHLSLPTQGGQQIPVMLISPHDIAESGGECWFGPKHEYDPSAPTKGRGVDGHVRFAWHSSRHDPSVDPPCLSRKIPVSFDRGVMELPLCTPPPGASIVPVPLRRSPAALSAAAIMSPEDAHFGRLLHACLEWHATAVSAVRTYAAMPAAAQAAFRACHGGRDAAADLQLGLSLFAQCLDTLASMWFPVVAGHVLSASAVPAPASALTAVLGLWAQRISALAVSAPSGAAVPAAPAISSPPSSSLPSRQ